jgi:glycosyltransferase involved in cell wall biosynthesis
MKPLRVGIVCDLREEGWHSMDLIADMLLDALPCVAGREIEAVLLRPPMVHRWTRLPLVGSGARARLGDRLTGRLWDYPRWLARRRSQFDVFHIVDHSYAHLVRALPAERTIVTCNDTDAFRAALPGAASRFDPARLLASHVLDGVSRASHVACISEATRRDLMATGRVSAGRTSVVHLGVHPSCNPQPDAAADAEIDRRLGLRRFEVLHVGSTIPRKRIDLLLDVFAAFRRIAPDATLVRAGGPLNAEQRAQAERLGLLDAMVEMPFLDRSRLAALYRRAAVAMLPSDREGFCLPVVEAMACGTPVVASDIPALREVGGDAAVYCEAGNIAEWLAALTRVYGEYSEPNTLARRRRACLDAAARFDWKQYARQMAHLYLQPFTRMRAS